MNALKDLEEKHLKKEIAPFKVGDTMRVYVKVVEDEKTRLQAFEGTVIQRKGSSTRATFTVRRVSYGEGIERVFPLHSPSIDRIQVVKPGKVGRATLFHLRKAKP